MSVADKYTTLTSEKIPSVYEEGKKVFWHTLIDGVKVFDDFFSCKAWNNKTFCPELDIAPTTSAQRMFGQNCGITDFDEALQQAKGNLDTSKCLKLDYFISNNSVEVAPVISVESATSTMYLLHNLPNLHTVKKIIAKETGGCPNMYYTFSNCPNVVNADFEGYIDRSMNIQGCTKLSIDSLVDLFKHLMDFTGTAKEFMYTITLSEESKNLLNDNDVTIDGVDWETYVDSKCWNVV